jgi:hypothetical protein
MKKSSRSGISSLSDGQYVGVPVDIHELLSIIIAYNSLPFAVVSLDPQIVCLLLKSPPAIN